MALYILLLTLLSLYCKVNATSQQGRIGLWSDSECNSKSGDTSNFGEQDPIALNFTLLADVCGVPGATVHSYRVLQNATCANGTTAGFDYYNSNNCTADPTDENPNPGLAKRMKDRRDSTVDGECLALVAFNSLAFVCDGVTPRNEKVNTLSTSAIVPTAASASPFPSVSFTIISTSASNQSATTPRSSATIPSTTSSQSSKPALSAGASAGIGVGSAIGVLAIAALCFFCFRRRATGSTNQGNGHTELSSANAAMTSASGTRGTAYETGIGQPHEIGGNAIGNVHEAGTDSEIHEIAGQRMNLVHEFYG